MNNKGFTLIELLISISIVSIILFMVLAVSSTLTDKAATKSYENEVKYIENASKLYFENYEEGNHVNWIVNDDEKMYYIEIKDLIDNQYFDEVINPLTKQPFSNNTKIEIKVKDGIYSYFLLDENNKR